jgi:hypothetical protein
MVQDQLPLCPFVCPLAFINYPSKAISARWSVVQLRLQGNLDRDSTKDYLDLPKEHEDPTKVPPALPIPITREGG